MCSAPPSAATNFRRAIGTIIGPAPAPSGQNPGQRDDIMLRGLQERAHTTTVTAGCPLRVISTGFQSSEPAFMSEVPPVPTEFCAPQRSESSAINRHNQNLFDDL